MLETRVWYEGTPKFAINGCFVKKVIWADSSGPLWWRHIQPWMLFFLNFSFFPWNSLIHLSPCDISWLWPQPSCNGAHCLAHVPHSGRVLQGKNSPRLFGEYLDDVSPGLQAVQWWLWVKVKLTVGKVQSVLCKGRGFYAKNDASCRNFPLEFSPWLGNRYWNF